MMQGNGLKWLAGAIAALSVAGTTMGGCAADPDNVGSQSSGDPVASGSGTGGNTSGSGGAATGGTGGNLGPCSTDCSAIQTPQCQVAQCNQQSGMCEVVGDEDGVACDDGVFCTISDSCSAGNCVGGPPNDCGMQPAACNEISCDESSQTCSDAPASNGTMCQDPNDLCVKGSSCSNGLCIGGAPEDCFFFPVPSDCHVATCNSTNGMCEAVVGNETLPCTDPNDLCTVDKTCTTGVCQGGNPKNCSQLTQGCVLGVCDTANGQCITQNLMNNDPCDDLDSCTTNETCQNGGCSNGTPVTACVPNDGCCPMNCTVQNDIDCACTTENIVTSYTSDNGFNGNMFDIVAVKNIEILSFDANLAIGAHTMEVYHRAGSHVGFENANTGWTLIGSAAVNSIAQEAPTAVGVNVNVQIQAGQTHTFYVTTTGSSNRYINGTTVGSVFVSNQDLQVLEGVGKSYPFASTFTTRNFSGTIHYEQCGN
jgi:hypothetical protein